MQPDSNELGDKRLNPEESVAKQREELLAIRHKKHDFPGQELLADEDRSTGARMPSGEFITRLQKLNPAILVRDGIPGNVALYTRKSENEMARDGYDLLRPRWWNEHKYACGFPVAELPEWGHLTLDSDGVAEYEYHGWRSKLIALIKAKAFTYEAAIKEFGDPIEDTRSKFWFEQLQGYRKSI